MSYSPCPKCGAITTGIELGDLLTERCPACSHEQFAWMARAFPDLPRSIPVTLTLRAGEKATARQLKVVRTTVRGALSLSPEELQTALSSNAGLVVSPLGKGFALDLIAQLTAEGLEAELQEVVSKS